MQYVDCGAVGLVNVDDCSCECLSIFNCSNGGYFDSGICQVNVQRALTCAQTLPQCQCVGGWTGDTCNICPIPLDERDTFCQNNGTWNNETCSCDCPNLWQGNVLQTKFL